MLTQAWQETLPRETLSFDVLQLPRQPAQLLTIDEVRIHFRVWDGGQWRTLRTATHLMQRDLYALHPAHEGKTLIYTDGGGWIYTEKEIISHEPTRTVPIGRLVDKEGVARAVCFDHQEQAPYYYVLEKPLLNDQFYLAPDDLLSDEIQSLVMQVRAWRVRGARSIPAAIGLWRCCARRRSRPRRFTASRKTASRGWRCVRGVPTRCSA